MSLTDNWKADKLVYYRRYFIKETNNENGDVFPAYLDGDNCFYLGNTRIAGNVEVLSLCDYEELQQLKLKKELAVNTADSYAEENEQLRNLLKECRKTIETQKIFFAPEFECVKMDYNRILTRIDDVIGRGN